MQVGLLSMSSSSEGSREPFPSLPVQSHRVYQPRWMMACSRCPGPCDSLLTSQMNRGPHLPKAPKHTPIQRARFLSFMYQICGAVSIVRIIDALFPLVCHITHARVTSMYSEFFLLCDICYAIAFLCHFYRYYLRIPTHLSDSSLFVCL